ncbi:DEAD/DEAH box helicase family protein [Exiguobacterium profundum]|uniref:DEAD/DEAH box helicase family protein n=1 Tax=Exiguobacterium TaxID=33986 RepID=UPI002036BAC1|nr:MULTISPECIES: DEAD/DEAH box helicase family protein [Exiguobacterium]MCT4797234.1 DEAD/DEAH box helicase family protein [Exiguobacterium profundum]
MSDLRLHTSNLGIPLQEHIDAATEIYMVVAFAQVSGVKELYSSLKQASESDAQIRILVGDYLYLTDPDALDILLQIPNIELRLYRSKGRSFHPKAYLFRTMESGTFFVGSSNLSHSALNHGVEWNVEIPSSVSEEVFEESVAAFHELFYSEYAQMMNPVSLQSYREEYEARKDRMKELEVAEHSPVYIEDDSITPTSVQDAALLALRETMAEGRKKAMLVLATGLGKTYLSAFFARQFNRILFVAHQKELLLQAEKSFLNVATDWKTGLLLGGESRNQETADVVFASIQTLASKQRMEQYDPEQFDLIIVDEFHHSAAPSYRRVLDYFQPKFLLGLTATPDRLDGGDVYALCDDNVAFQMHFTEAIEESFLTPFHYVGIYDEIDYSQIRLINGRRYDQEELLAEQLKESVAEKIYKAWSEHHQSRALGFCSSVVQAEYLADYFRRQGVQAVALHSQAEYDRTEVITQLKHGQLDIIFAVNLFNEGVDIPEIDTLLFCRPTESLTVFTQQIGRGLRLSKGKTHCTIIDLIGNYKNIDKKLALLTTDGPDSLKKVPTSNSLPTSCTIEFDLETVDLLKKMMIRSSTRHQLLERNYFMVKEELGRRPTYLELIQRGEYSLEAYQSERKHFSGFFGFLKKIGELTDGELSVFENMYPLLYEVEDTRITTSYKMVVLSVMLERGKQMWYTPLKASDAAYPFYDYLTSVPYRQQIDGKTKDFQQPFHQQRIEKLLVRMPFDKIAKGPFYVENESLHIEFNEALRNPVVYEWVSQIVEVRLHYYFSRKAQRSSD